MRHEILSFGGYDYPNGQVKVFDTTWIYKNGTWTKLHPTHIPWARTSAGVVFDARNRVVVMYGGRDVPPSDAAGTDCEVGGCTYSDDTWIWNGSDWTQQHPVHTPKFFLPDLAFDVAHQAVLLLGLAFPVAGGGDLHMETWTWNGLDWTHQVKSDGSPQPIVTQTRLAYDPATQKVICFGGRNDGGGTLSNPWLWDGTTWSELRGVATPNVSYFGPMAREGSHPTLLVFDWKADGNATWRWNGTSFEQLSPLHEPDIFGEVIATDSESGVLLGGLTQSFDYELWRWTGSDWIPASL